MNNYYQNQAPSEDLQRQLAEQQRRNQQTILRQMGMNTGHSPQPTGQPSDSHSATSHTGLMSGESLDEIVQNNLHELNRRRSLPPQNYQACVPQDDPDPRMSMMEFGNPDDSFRNFHIGTGTGTSMVGPFPNMGGDMSMSSHSEAYPQPGITAMSSPGHFSTLSSDVQMNNMMDFSTMRMGSMAANPAAMDLSGQPNLASQFAATTIEPVSADFSMHMGAENPPMSAVSASTAAPMRLEGEEDDMMTVSPAFGPSNPPMKAQPPQDLGAQENLNLNLYQPSVPPAISHETSNTTSLHSPILTASQNVGNIAQPSVTPGTPSTITPPIGPRTPTEIKFEKNLYSKSGFDMIRALYYVASRPDPEVHLGAVDMSCAFVVCDVTLNDCPIVYVSDNFQNLTGYSQHDIVGQNCRFLQAPDGKVEAGTKREFVENSAVYNLKRKIQEGKEVQQSLINYRKGGKPFLNLLTMVPIPWDTKEIRYFVGFQIDLVECPDAIAGQGMVNYKHSDIGQYIWTPPTSGHWDPDNGQTLGVDDVSTLLQQFNPKGVVSDWHKQSWDKMLLENTDDVVHVLSLKGLFLYLSPACKKVLEYDTNDLVGSSLSSICHPSDIVPVTRELKDTTAESPVNIVFRIRRKQSGYTWFESHGSLFIEQGKGRKCIILVGRKRPVFALHRRDLEANGGIGDAEFWTKLSTSGLFLFVSSNVRSLLDLQPENLEGTSIQDLMRKESRGEFGRSIEKARRGKMVMCKHEVQNRRGQVLQAQTILYPGDAGEGSKATFLLAQTRLLKASSRAIAPAATPAPKPSLIPGLPDESSPGGIPGSIPGSGRPAEGPNGGVISSAHGGSMVLGSQDAALAADDNIFDELKTTRCTSWQYELRQMEKINRLLAEELGQLLSNKKKRKRRKGVGNVVKDCANCHTRNTPEWRRGPSGQRDLCNSCGLRWAKQMGRVSPRTSSRGGNDNASKKSNSPIHSSPLQREVTSDGTKPAGSPAPKTVVAEAAISAAVANNASPNAATRSTNNTIGMDNVQAGGSGNTTPMGPSGQADHTMPPPSQPLLEGGAGFFRGAGMEMTAIREERENSA